MILHAGLIASFDGARWRGILLRGPSGSGKSDLALRALDHGFRIVADDRVLVFRSTDRVFGRPPPALAGLIELRGIGVIQLPTLRLAEVSLVFDCVPGARIERTPEFRSAVLLDVPIPLGSISALEASAPAKLCRAVEVLGRGQQQDYDAAFPQTASRRRT